MQINSNFQFSMILSAPDTSLWINRACPTAQNQKAHSPPRSQLQAADVGGVRQMMRGQLRKIFLPTNSIDENE
jgi:hypothetical protein